MRVGPDGPIAATIAVVAQCPGPDEGKAGRLMWGQTGSLFRGWLDSVGIPNAAVYFTNLVDLVMAPGVDLPKDEIKSGKPRVQAELRLLPNLKGVILVGSPAAHLAFKGAMGQMHGKSGTLDLGGGRGKDVTVPCIAVYHPSFVSRARKGKNGPRRFLELENDSKTILARAKLLGQEVELPAVKLVASRYAGTPVQGFLGLDTETHGIPDLREAMGLNKGLKKNRPDPRASVHELTGLADGRVYLDTPPVLDPEAEPIAHNLPYDGVVVGQPNARWHDSKMLAHLMGYKDTVMKSLALRVLGRPMMGYDEASGMDPATFRAYCVQDAECHEGIFRTLHASATPEVLNCYEVVERPMMPLYIRWSMEGVFRLRRSEAEARVQEFTVRLAELKAFVEGELGIENANSPHQVKKALGTPNADARTLANLEVRLPVGAKRTAVAALREYRTKSKRLSTYLLPYLKWPFDRIGTLWRPCGAWTGRPSSGDLNLQNFPADVADLLEADPGHVLYHPDYSQLEIRIAAHLSQDPAMLAAIRSGVDFHQQTMDSLGLKDRRYAKIGNFATLYGGTEGAIVEQAHKYGIAEAEIRPLVPDLQAGLRKLYPRFFEWSRSVQDLERIPGLFGRTHVPPPGYDQNARRREAVNAPIQGGAVDCVKLATLKAESGGFNTRHMIHDDVWVQVTWEEATPDWEMDLKRSLETAVKLTIPLEVEVKRWEPTKA